MEISFDPAIIQDVLNKQAEKGIKDAFEGYSVRAAMEKAIGDSVLPNIIASAMEQAASQVDTTKLVEVLSTEMAKSITIGVQHIVRDTMCNIIMDIRKVPTYDEKARATARAEILAKF